MQRLRNWLRDRIPDRTLATLISSINKMSGNYLNRPLYGRATYNEDGLVSSHYAGFMQEERFKAAYAAGRATGSWPHGDLHWRAQVICWAAERGASLPGDFVECGVNRGGFALTAMKYVRFETLRKRFFLLDTFGGLVAAQLSADERAAGLRGGGYEPCYEAVLETFAPYGLAVRVIKGVVPSTLASVDAERVAFLSIDMNAREPEIAAAEFFWDKLAPGAAMVLDDYGWRKHVSQRIAFDAFARQRNVPLLALPTGQGLILKP
jgi:O-methyltransferase